MFQDIYKPSPKRTRGRKTDSVPTANVFTMAEKAVKRWQCEFFRYCPFDSEKRPQLKHGPWDHVCSLCMEHVYPIGHEPKKATAQWHEEDFRCPKCDHRETMQWNGASWFAVKWGAVEGSEHGEWKPVES